MVEQSAAAARVLAEDFGSILTEDDAQLRALETQQASQVSVLNSEMDTLARRIAALEKEVEAAELRRDEASSMLQQHRAQEEHHQQTEREAGGYVATLGATYGTAVAGAESDTAGVRLEITVYSVSRRGGLSLSARLT